MKKSLVVMLSVLLIAAQFLGCAQSSAQKELTDSPSVLTYQTNESEVFRASFTENYQSSVSKYNDKISKIPGFEDKTVEEINIVNGFNGEPYAVVECSPTGYLIYQCDQDVLLEFSSKSKSPYYGKGDNLLYLGPTYYFEAKEAKQKSQFVVRDLYDKKEVALTKDQFNEIKGFSASFSDSIRQKAVEDKNKLKAQEDNTVMPMTYYKSGSWEYWYVDNKTTITKLKQNFGYIGGGYCGYIATVIMLYYLEMHHPLKDFLPPSCYTSDGPNTDATNLLLDVARVHHNWTDPATTGPKIASVLGTHLFFMGATLTPNDYHAEGLVTPFWNHGTIRNQLLKNAPVVLFGKTQTPIQTSAHAVLSYGSMKENVFMGIIVNNYHVVHFGWISNSSNDYTEIVIKDDVVTNIFGSIAYIYKR